MNTTKALNPVNTCPVANNTVLTKSQTKTQFRKKKQTEQFYPEIKVKLRFSIANRR